MAQARKSSTKAPRQPRFVRDGVDLYIHVDDLCDQLNSVPLNSPAQVAQALQGWKASMNPTPSQGGHSQTKSVGRKP